MSAAAAVGRAKRQHPEQFCPRPGCLWRTGGGYCPRHLKAGLVRLTDRDEEDIETTERLSHDRERLV